MVCESGIENSHGFCDCEAALIVIEGSGFVNKMVAGTLLNRQGKGEAPRRRGGGVLDCSGGGRRLVKWRWLVPAVE